MGRIYLRITVVQHYNTFLLAVSLLVEYTCVLLGRIYLRITVVQQYNNFPLAVFSWFIEYCGTVTSECGTFQAQEIICTGPLSPCLCNRMSLSWKECPVFSVRFLKLLCEFGNTEGALRCERHVDTVGWLFKMAKRCEMTSEEWS